MQKVTLTDEQWRKILPFLRSCPNVYVGEEADCRKFLQAVLWRAQSGAQWRLLPASYGNWNSIYKRFARWCEQGVWQQLDQHCAADPDLERLIRDSAFTGAHPRSAGELKRNAATRGSEH
ncbi:MAG: transposase [Blastocatellia bacterium]|nr:transposase [Blastocatellia bacterium]